MRTWKPALGLALLSGLGGPAWADDGGLPLRVEPSPRTTAAESDPPGSLPRREPPAPATPAARPARPSHQKGPAPKTPADRLPAGSPRPEADEAARRGVAEGPTRERLEQGPDDPELVALREADQVLFPTELRGVEPGWSWDLPEAKGGGGAPRGLPPRPRLSVEGADVAQADAEWLRALTLPDLPVRLDRRVVTYLKFYRDSPRGRTIAAIWARKSGRYVGALKAELRRAGLPPDLVWLSMIESGHNPTITSPAGAAGLWQFMATSARSYGLTVDRWVDERRDPMRSTTAAIALLGDLYQRFGNWELAMAAYNMGYAGLTRAITKFNTNDYWALSKLEGGIPWETTLYVPKIFALAIVMNNREAFGLGRITVDPPISFDTVLVEPATDLTAFARDARLDKRALLELNPALLAERLPPASGEPRPYPVRVPSGQGPSAQRALTPAAARQPTVVVRRGDDLTTLCADYGGSEAEWTRLNKLAPGERLEVGTLLLAPPGARREARPPEAPTYVVSRVLRPAPSERHVFYEVRSQDDLEQVAAALGVGVRELSSWNALDPQARLREGMTLQALVDRERDLSRVRLRDARGAQLLVAGSAEFHEHFEAQRGMRRVQVVARAGDTLATLGQRYGMTVGSMERVNRRARTTPLVPGEILIVYTNRPGGSATPDPGGQPLEEAGPPRPDLLPMVADGAH